MKRLSLALLLCALINITVADGVDTDNSANDNTEYLEAIRDLEGQFGPYHPELSEQLNRLGTHYQQQGLHQEANEAFQRAMHLARINEGLYSLNQVTALEGIIATSIAKHDWEQVNDSYQYLYWLHLRNYDAQDPNMLPILDKLGDWHINAYMLNLGNGFLQHLINAHNTYSSAASIITTHFGPHDLRLVETLRGVMLSNYLLATHQYSSESNSSFEASFNERTRQSDELLRQEQFILKSFYNGKSAINQMQQALTDNPDTPPNELYHAQVELGDWYMMFNRPNTAIEVYRQVIHDLNQKEDGEKTLHELFDQPVALPDISITDLITQGDNEANIYIDATFDVTESGRAVNIEITKSVPEESIRFRSKVKESLKATKFRPKFIDGEPVRSELVKRQYVFVDK